LALSVEAEAQVDLNPEYGDSAYQFFSVFEPELGGPENYQDEVVVVFHGFLSAIPNGTYKRVLRALGPSRTVIGINYDPLDVGGTVEFLNEVYTQRLKDKRVITLGTSLGAFWALYFGEQFGAEKVIMVNPVVAPAEQLREHVGTEPLSERRTITYRPTVEALERYRALDPDGSAVNRMLLILSRDDDVLDYRVALDEYQGHAGTDIVLYAQGGHTLQLKTHPAIDAIAGFVREKRLSGKPCM
jgi:predicted esterase YcpF (UPF0227 family)